MQERWQGVDLNKFPGGGLELGEGLLECIHREIDEEFSSSEKLAYSHFFTPYRMLLLAIQAARATAVELLYQWALRQMNSNGHSYLTILIS
jgi:hypothetical protein